MGRIGLSCAENARRLSLACSRCCEALDEVQVPYLRPSAGMFMWVDLSKYLTENTWAGEEALFLAMKEEARVLLTPGQSQHAVYPGCFRICFAFACMETLEEGLRRLKDFVRARG